ncbi:hypothetical protein C2E25_16505, partial [Geothermobacter hydrogeniphilus]
KGGDLVQYRGKWYAPEEAAQLKAEAKKQAEFADLLEQLESGYRQAQRRLDAKRVSGLKKTLAAAEQLYPRDKRIAPWSAKLSELPSLIKQQQQKKKALLSEAEGALMVYDKELAIRKAKAALQVVPGDAEAQALLAKAKKLPEKYYTDPTTGMDFVLVPGGCYQMGSNNGGSDEKPVHEVCVDAFYMGKYEVTNGQYRKYKSGHDSGSYKGNTLNRDQQPVVMVSWEDATAFARWLSGKSGKAYRLPSEAEWEYAARGGTRSARWWGNNPDQACGNANVADRTAKRMIADQTGKRKWSDETIHNCDDGYAVSAPVGHYKANPYGLYDILGNVWEWCQDWYDSGYYGNSPRNNPQGPSSGSDRVLRGGSWGSNPGHLRSADRGRNWPGYRSSGLGFRLALPAGS